MIATKLLATGFKTQYLFLGPKCGKTQCEYGSECCKTCNEQGELVDSGECESRLNGNPGCTIVNCLPEGISC